MSKAVTVVFSWSASVHLRPHAGATPLETPPIGGSTYRNSAVCLAGDLRHPRRAGAARAPDSPSVEAHPGDSPDDTGTSDTTSCRISTTLAPMTALYAKLSDKTVREHWERAARSAPRAARPDQPRRAARRRRLGETAASRATQALPNGYCQLPLVKTCPHANSCLTCPMFVKHGGVPPAASCPAAGHLADHHDRRSRSGDARVAEMNRQVAGNLDKIIATLEAEGPDEKEAAAVRPDPLSEAAARRHELTRPKAVPGAARTGPGLGSPVTFAGVAQAAGISRVVALYPARHQRPDPQAAAKDKVGTGSADAIPAGEWTDRRIAAGQARRRPRPQQAARRRERTAPPPARPRVR